MAVLIVHISAIPVHELPKESFWLPFFVFINRMHKFTTPAFLFLSGFLLMEAYGQNQINYKIFLKKRLTNIIWPYVFYNLLYFGVYAAAGKYAFSFPMFIKMLILGEINYHFYFITILVQFYILFPWIQSSFDKFSSNFLLIMALMGNLIFMKYGTFFYSDRFFLQYIFFFCFGCWASTKKSLWTVQTEKFVYGWGIMYGGFGIIYAIQYYMYGAMGKYIDPFYVRCTWFSFSFISIIFLYGLSIRSCKARKKKNILLCMEAISKHSYDIYLLHPLVLAVVDYALVKAGIMHPVFRYSFHIYIFYLLSFPFFRYYQATKYKIYALFLGIMGSAFKNMFFYHDNTVKEKDERKSVFTQS